MVEKGWFGNKTKQGFYKQTKVDGKKQFWPLNLQTLEHEPAGDKPRFDSVGKAKDIEDKGERLKVLMAGDDRAAELAKAFIYFGFSYTVGTAFHTHVLSELDIQKIRFIVHDEEVLFVLEAILEVRHEL